MLPKVPGAPQDPSESQGTPQAPPIAFSLKLKKVILKLKKIIFKLEKVILKLKK